MVPDIEFLNSLEFTKWSEHFCPNVPTFGGFLDSFRRRGGHQKDQTRIRSLELSAPLCILRQGGGVVGTVNDWSSLTRRKQWQPPPVLLPGKSHGQRSLVGFSPWGLKESDTTERLHFHFTLSCIGEGNGNPLQCSCLENPRDSGAWWAAVYGVAQSRTRLQRLRKSSSNILNYVLKPPCVHECMLGCFSCVVGLEKSSFSGKVGTDARLKYDKEWTWGTFLVA